MQNFSYDTFNVTKSPDIFVQTIIETTLENIQNTDNITMNTTEQINIDEVFSR